jgi:YD repeat-containing protein
MTGPGLATPPTYDDQDRLTQYGSTTYSYTASGELKTKTVNGQPTAYSYDELWNLLSVTLPDGRMIEYIIDGQNRRIGKKVGGNLVKGFLYQDRLKPIVELDGANQVVSRFVYATHRNVPDYFAKITNGVIVTYRIITDRLGSPRLIVNTADGKIAQL